MTVSKQTQICWHNAPLQFGPILNRNGQPVPRLKMTSLCQTAPRDTLGQSAWLQYLAMQKDYLNTSRPSMNVIATRIDVWKSDSKGNLPSGQTTVSRRSWQALCASASPPQLRYPDEGTIDVVCNAKVNSYVQGVFFALLKPSAITPDAPIARQAVPSFYVVKPFQVEHNYDFEAIDGTLAHGDPSSRNWYKNPHAHSTVREIVYAPDGTVLIPDAALVRLKNEAQFAALLSYSLAAEDQDLIGRLFRVQRFKVHLWSSKEGGENNLFYMNDFIMSLNNQELLIGISQMYLAGYDVRYAPFAWSAEQGQSIKGPADEPNKHMPIFAASAFDYLSQYYSDVDYSKLKRGEAEYAQFLDELRKADPEAFAETK
jgi:hypothetical protein